MYQRKAEINLEFQPMIEHLPVSMKHLWQQSTSNDDITINTWRPQWIKQTQSTFKRYGSFKEKSVGKLFGQYALKPCIVAGSGPSLKHNAHELKNRKDIPLVSCLHNFHYFEDLDLNPEYYVTLDAGNVTVEEVSEGGTKSEEEYWARTKDRKLIAFIGTHPELLEKWRGEVYLFNCPVPDKAYEDAVAELERFPCLVSTGGNVLGASFYIARAIFGANPIAFVGADFSFGYDRKFHAWDSKYDKDVGRVLKTIDVFGNKVMTWQSYHNFKCWFDAMCAQVPGQFINCTEGGTMGAYPEGNIAAIKQMGLKQFISAYYAHEHVREQCENQNAEMKILF